ncbi:P-loop containing nucleoside triphosphate hydrolase protein [Spinellus fusiger]|nr:P-loop containing nucleoside triphosphate hydrolase protein [Spinellus fusiger]
MAKKKNKVVSQRGFATVSAPSKKVAVEKEQEICDVEPVSSVSVSELVKAAEAVKRGLPREEEHVDPIVKLVEHYHAINERKSEKILESLTQREPKDQRVPEEQIKGLNIPARVEQTILKTLQRLEEDTTFRFDHQDIEHSFEATLALTIEEHLDWLCVNVPYERMPLGFYDKYFNELDTSIRIGHCKTEEAEEEESINIKYARLNLQLMSLEKQMPSKKKKGKHPPNVLSGTALEVAERKIKDLRNTLSNLETDWEFDKKQSHNALVALVAEKKKAHEEREEENRRREESLPVPEVSSDPVSSIMNQTTLMEEKEEEDTLLGGLMMEEEECLYERTFTNTSSLIKAEDFSVSSWKGDLPKDLLKKYCEGIGYRVQSYTNQHISTNLWRATVHIKKPRDLEASLSYELPATLGATQCQDAEQLVARVEKEESIKRVSRERLSFLVHLVEKSYEGKKKTTSEETSFVEKTPSVQANSNVMDMDMFSKRKDIFPKVQTSFEKRLNTDGYLDMKRKRNELPIAAYREQILELVQTHQVIVISGETGCGKSTQVPQFLAEALLTDPSSFGSVVCTQPRRISAMSIAQRVSTEMGDPPRTTGTHKAMVGYQIRLESKVSPENTLVFCTTGILLRRLESDKLLSGITHVIVDEVHERTIDSDFLLIILRRLCHIRPDLRVVLMSATAETNRFSSYFNDCPVVVVPGRTFPVHVRYLEDVVEATGYVLESDSPYAVQRKRVRQEQGSVEVAGKFGSSRKVRLEWFEDDSDADDPYDPTYIESKLTSVTHPEDEDETNTVKYSKQTYKMLRRMDENKINYDILLHLIEYICIYAQEQKEYLETSQIPSTGAILIFLPGMPEIRKLFDIVSSHHQLGDPEKYLLIALHSALSSEHQERAFDTPPPGVRKIILSTNIAETGVTISDVTIVIDTGMAKVISYDDKKKITRLRQTFVTKANAKQRRGRAGRVQEGICFHLFSQHRYEMMANYETPEILRLPLEELCLRIKVQALSFDGTETLTPLGVHLSNLPVNVHIGKMILFGAIFQCLDPVLTIAASLSFKSPFVRPFGKEKEADIARARFMHAHSDFWTIYMAYTSWRTKMNQVQGKANRFRQMHEFCNQHFLSQKNMEMIEDMKKQYLDLLISIGFVHADRHSTAREYEMKHYVRLCHIPSAYNIYAESVPIVNAAITAGLYPKIASLMRATGSFISEKLTMKIHPSSILFGHEKGLSSEFVAYNTIIMNNDKVYLWEASSIDSIAVMLLATNMEIKHKQRRVVLDHWIHFSCFARSAVLVKLLRTELNNLLAAKMNQPDLDLTSVDQEIMSSMVMVLEQRGTNK